ncbi:MAG TPA: Asp-tRNA(Asn)/Glu-tRNA(Gln) amidotransferase subunit GatA [Candidatus Saccharimonadales bacterium]|nr:Asp-tRNA(Asn)/Glu-tRNA(Gln) amidotransferase subunit GatA [Candidatus Saccharimonadales bacterium]
MIDLKRPIAELVADVQAGKLDPVDLVKASLEAIKANEDYHAILEVNERALDQAKKANKQGKLAGIPFIAKDNFLTSGTHTTASSNILKPFQAPYQATVIEKLEAEGAIMVAKANLDAFAHGSSTENSDFGPTKNPHDKSRVPGGSSGGSAAAVALGLACFALGTDTGGSIRQPAALSGVVGLKPTYGLVSRYGVVAMGSSVDVIGPLTNSVADAALVLDVMAGQDPNDSTTIDSSKLSLRSGGRSGNLKNLKIGLIKEYLAEGTQPEVRQAVLDAAEKFKSAGATVEEVSLPSVDLALACYYILVPAEVSSNLSRYDGIRFGHSSSDAKTLSETFLKSRDEGFGAEAKRRIIIGTYVLSSGYYDAYYKQAQKVRTLLVKEFDEAFKEFDLLISPTAPTTAFKLGEKSDPLAMYLNDVDTVAVNLVGNCAISIPAGETDSLPIGLQLIAPQKGEEVLLDAAAAAEELLA